MTAPPRPPVRVGVDLVRVDEVAESAAGFGDRYLRRIYTDHELACCGTSGDAASASLAARFAAKEAVLKVLEPDGARPEWRAIEVWRRPEGACEIRLHGRAAQLARRAGLGPMAVSLTHEAGLAAAVVVAAHRRTEPEIDE